MSLNHPFKFAFAIFLLLISCTSAPKEPSFVVELSPEESLRQSNEIRERIAASLEDGLTLSVWGVDTLVADPIALDMDEQGRAHITVTNRQTNSEFDIRGHRDWEIGSIRLQHVDDRRNVRPSGKR